MSRAFFASSGCSTKKDSPSPARASISSLKSRPTKNRIRCLSRRGLLQISSTFARDCATFLPCFPRAADAAPPLPAEAAVEAVAAQSSIHVDQFDFVAIAIESHLYAALGWSAA